MLAGGRLFHLIPRLPVATAGTGPGRYISFVPLLFLLDRFDLFDQQRHDAAAEGQRVLDAFGDAAARPGPHDGPVDDDFHAVLAPGVERGRLRGQADLAIDAHPRVAGVLEPIEQGSVAFAVTQADWGENDNRRAGLQSHDARDDFVHRLRTDRHVAVRAVALANSGPQHAHVVIDLRHRPHRRARALGRGPLLDTDRRREPVHVVHARLGHLAEELARVGRQRLDIAPIALGKHRVDREAGLARARHTRTDRHLIARERDRQVLEVVLPCADHRDRMSIEYRVASGEFSRGRRIG